jgi:hypothetical protein
MTGEWNVCQVRGCGAWWPYKSKRVVLGQFGLVGIGRCSGWAAGAVGRVRGVQEEPCWGREMRGEAAGWVYLMDAQDLAWDLSYSLQSLRDKYKRDCYSRI